MNGDEHDPYPKDQSMWDEHDPNRPLLFAEDIIGENSEFNNGFTKDGYPLPLE